MTTYLDYANRTVDVAAFRGQRSVGDTLLALSLADDETGGEVCTGALMVAQAWLLEFLKEEDSAAYFPSGSSFALAARQGRLNTELDVLQEFNLASAQIRMRLLQSELDTDPDDERFVSAKLDHVFVSPGFVRLSVTVTTRAGSSRKVILPLPIVV